MQSIKFEVEDDVYAKFAKLDINIEEEFQKFLLQNNLEKESEEKKETNKKPSLNYWDALGAEIQAIKKINSQIFTKYEFRLKK